jgi:hypothetical protein
MLSPKELNLEDITVVTYEVKRVEIKSHSVILVYKL